MKRMKLWYTTLVEYDEVGNATILKSFMSPAKDSETKYADKKKDDKPKNVKTKVNKGGKLWE